MIHEAQTTVRNAGLLLGQKSFYIAGGFLFAALVSRLMGPELYGRYGLITSLALWFVLISDPGLTQIMVQYVPQFRLQKTKEDLKKFFGNLLALALVNSFFVAGFYFFLTKLWFQDLDGRLLVTAAGAVFFRASAQPFFSFFLGLNPGGTLGDQRHPSPMVLFGSSCPWFLSGRSPGCLFRTFTVRTGDPIDRHLVEQTLSFMILHSVRLSFRDPLSPTRPDLFHDQPGQ